MTPYSHPHIAITVNDYVTTKTFYEQLGFTVLVENYSQEKQRNFMLLEGYGMEMEVFWFKAQPASQSVSEDDLQKVGIKHLALPVEDLVPLRDLLVANGITLLKDISTSSLGLDNLNITDPLGLIIEFFQRKG